LELRQRFSGGFDIEAVGVELQISIELRDGFVAFLHLLGDPSESEMGLWIVRLNLYGVFGTEIGGV
jgi:hypothetical protein